MKVFSAILISFLLLGSAVAQSEESGFELFAGYSLVNSHVGLNGWHITGTYRPESTSLALLGDVSGTYGSDKVFGRKLASDMYAAIFGPRLYIDINNDSLTPFGGFVVGLARNSTWFGDVSKSDTAWAWSSEVASTMP